MPTLLSPTDAVPGKVAYPISAKVGITTIKFTDTGVSQSHFVFLSQWMKMVKKPSHPVSPTADILPISTPEVSDGPLDEVVKRKQAELIDQRQDHVRMV